jgi:hypothetical protein
MDGTVWRLDWLKAIVTERSRIEKWNCLRFTPMPIASSKPLRMRNSVAVRSSSLAQVAYDDLRDTLQIEFRDGTAYQYADVPIRIYHDLLRADSKGAYFNQYIRSRFPHAVI